MQMSEDFKKRYTRELCTKELEKEYEIFTAETAHGSLDYSCTLCTPDSPTILWYQYSLRGMVSSYRLTESFIDPKNPSEEELIMFELETGFNKYVLLLLLTFEVQYKSLYLRKRKVV